LEQQLSAGEGRLVQDRLVFALVQILAMDDLADVDRVAQHPKHGLGAP